MTAPKIVTSCQYPPIPDRRWDWLAHYEGREENGEYGWGPTEQAAIDDLLANYDPPLSALDTALAKIADRGRAEAPRKARVDAPDTSRSFDAITRRAVARMTAHADWFTVLRVQHLARDQRELRAAKAFLDRLARPHSAHRQVA